jgi:phage host-nuclease inhibitor protein Gam
MPKITIDYIEYNTEDLTENGKAQLASLQFLEVQLQKLRNEIAVYQTAQRTYLAALKAEIEKSGVEPLAAAAQPEE